MGGAGSKDEDFVWSPPGLGDDEAVAFLATREGIPSSSRPQIVRWLVRDAYDHDYVDIGEYLRFQTALRRPLGLLPAKRATVGTLRKWISELDERTLTALVDFRLSDLYPRPSFSPEPRDSVAALKSILHAAGSSWTVGDRNGRWGLVEALPDAVMAAAQAVVSQSGNASQLLNAAWANAFGVDKRPSHAYYDAVRAVEVFSCPLISPRDRSATLGKDINVLATKPEAWKFALSGDRSVERLLGAFRMLWHSQTDRHGREDYADVGVDEAQAAVLLATAIVGWLSQGLLTRVPASVVK